MPYITYTALRGIATTGYLKTVTDIRAAREDDDFKATNGLSGLSADQWVLASGFLNPANNGWRQAAENSSINGFKTLTTPMTHVRLSGNSNNYCTAPDSTANSVTGDIDLRARVAPRNWHPVSPSAVISKRSSGQASYQLIIDSSGFLIITWSADGSAIISKSSTVAVPFEDDDTPWWIRAMLDVNDGAGNNVVRFFYSADGVNWTQLGATVTTAGTTSIFNGTAALLIGAEDGTGNLYCGRVYQAEVRSGLNGAVVVAFDPSLAVRGASSFVAITGETWTLNSSSTPATIFQGSELIDEGAEYLYLPGSSGNFADTPDSVPNSITGDIDLRLKIALDDWTPAAQAVPLGKYTATGNQRAWAFIVTTGGNLQLTWSADGTATISKSSTVAAGFVDGTAHWIRVTLDVNDGAGNNVVKFYVSEDGVTWTQLGATVTTAGTTSIFNSTQGVEVGNTDGNITAGRVYRAEVRSGIGGQVVNCFDPSRALAGASTLTARTAIGETWTLHTSGFPVAALIRNTPVTLTGYVRGLGQQYSLTFGARSADLSIEVDREEAWPRDRSAPEVTVYGDNETIQVVTSAVDETELVQWREWRASVEGGETFIFDRYGMPAAPVEPRTAILLDRNYRETREPGSIYPSKYSLSFQVQLF